MSPAVGLRPAGPADQDFLRALFATTRPDELAALGPDSPAARAFLRMQFDARERAYTQAHPEARRDVVTVTTTALPATAIDAGAIWVEHTPTEILLLDIALLPEWRSRGTGTHVLGRLLNEADRSGRPVVLHVATTNPARRLYTRLGFTVAAQEGGYLRMIRSPATLPGPT